jgi:N-acetylmuramoyl-L-alanine amidase
MAPRRIALVIGHNARSPGAVRVTDQVAEYVWNSRLAEEIQNLNSAQVRVFRRRPAPTYLAEVQAVYAEVDAWKADVSCELHFNSYTSNSTGTETFHTSAMGRSVALKVQAKMVAALGLNDRGVKKVAKDGRGYESLVAGQCPAVLTEPYFGSNPGDCARADERFVMLAKAIFAGLGGAPAASSKPVPPIQATLEERVSSIEDRLDVAGI